MVKSITNRLGVHLFEVGQWHSFSESSSHLSHQVDCYSLLQENSTRTENSLRGTFSRATDFSPCVLLLRHLEALMHTTQQPDTRQGATTANFVTVDYLFDFLKNHASYTFCKNASMGCYNPGDSRVTHWWLLEPPAPPKSVLQVFLAVSSTRLTSRYGVVYTSVLSSHLRRIAPGRAPTHPNMERMLGQYTAYFRCRCAKTWDPHRRTAGIRHRQYCAKGIF
jgi:hypothetical protein